MGYVLRIKKRSQSEWFCIFILMLPFGFGFLIELLGVPGIVKYCVDILWMLLLMTMALNRFKMPNIESQKLFKFILFFIFVTLIGFIFNAQTPLYYLWGFRNNIRFYVFFFASIMFFKQDSIDDILRCFDKLFYINSVIMLFQFLVLGIKQDYLGGIFGVQVGCNGKTILFFSIVVARSILNYLNHKEKINQCIIKCAIAVVLSGLAELKGFFIIFVFIVAMAVLITNFTFRKLMIIVFSIIGIYAGINLLITIFPEWRNWFSIKSIFETAISSKGYTGQGDMNRLTSVPMIWKMFMKTWPERLFGLGLGNCDTSTFEFLNTAFYQTYAFLRYNWFSIAFMFLETGTIGLLCYMTFFVFIYFLAYKRERKNIANKEWCQLARIMSVVCLMLIIYNSSMRVEEAYIMYFVLALPFLKDNSLIRQEKAVNLRRRN